MQVSGNEGGSGCLRSKGDWFKLGTPQVELIERALAKMNHKAPLF